jgi:glycosyltransferase involved in cell wall biosynthesis
VVESHLATPFHQTGKLLTERLLCWLTHSTKSIRYADLLVALTEGDAQQWRGVAPLVRVISNPLPLAFSALTIQSLPATEHRIIAVGRLSQQKRFDRLIAAFGLVAHKYPEWRLDIFGEGQLCSALQEQIKQLGLETRVQIKAPTHQIVEEYLKSCFFVLSSDFEGFGMVIIEAMACGLPVVATNCPYGPSEIIEDGKTGLLSQMDVKDLAAKLDWMITHDAERMEMGLKAKEAAAFYKMEKVMQKWEQAYKSVTIK